MTDESRSQWFHFGVWTFNIQAAEELIRSNPRLTVQIDVATWASAYSLNHPDPPSIALIGPGPEFDPVYAMATDLNTPVLIALLDTDGAQAGPLLIDGCHRVYRASAEGVTRLPAYVLTVEETLSIREDRSRGPRSASSKARKPLIPAPRDGETS